MIYNGLDKLIQLVKDDPDYAESDSIVKEYDRLEMLRNLAYMSPKFAVTRLNTLEKLENVAKMNDNHIRDCFTDRLYQDTKCKSNVDDPFLDVVFHSIWALCILTISVILTPTLVFCGLTADNEDPLTASYLLVGAAISSIPFIIFLLIKFVDHLEGIRKAKIYHFLNEVNHWDWIQFASKKRLALRDFFKSNDTLYCKKCKKSLEKILDMRIIRNVALVESEFCSYEDDEFGDIEFLDSTIYKETEEPEDDGQLKIRPGTIIRE
jgi:hypothetical protein